MEKKITESNNLYSIGLKGHMEEFGLSAQQAYTKVVIMLSEMDGFEYHEHVTNLNRSLYELVGKKKALKTIVDVQKKLKIKPRND